MASRNRIDKDWERMYHKTLTATVQSDDTLSADAELVMPGVNPGETWKIQAEVRVTTTTVADFKLTLATPTGSTGWATLERVSTGGRTFIDFQTASFAFTDPNAAAEDVYILTAVIKVGAVGGAIALQWAQNTSTAVDTSLLAGSYMECERLPG